MKNPIGKFKREKLEEINFKVDSFIEEFNSVKEKIVLLEVIQTDLGTFKEDFEQIKEVLFYEPTEEEIKEQEKAAQEQVDNMKLIVRAAISDMLADPKNQEAIQTFAGQFAGAVQGKSLAGWEGITNEDGSLNWGVAIQMAQQQFGGKKSSSPISSSTGKRGAY